MVLDDDTCLEQQLRQTEQGRQEDTPDDREASDGDHGSDEAGTPVVPLVVPIESTPVSTCPDCAHDGVCNMETKLCDCVGNWGGHSCTEWDQDNDCQVDGQSICQHDSQCLDLFGHARCLCAGIPYEGERCEVYTPLAEAHATEAQIEAEEAEVEAELSALRAHDESVQANAATAAAASQAAQSDLATHSHWAIVGFVFALAALLAMAMLAQQQQQRRRLLASAARENLLGSQSGSVLKGGKRSSAGPPVGLTTSSSSASDGVIQMVGSSQPGHSLLADLAPGAATKKASGVVVVGVPVTPQAGTIYDDIDDDESL